MARAASTIAGFSRKSTAWSSNASRERTSRSSVSSPAQAPVRKMSRSPGARSITDCSRLSTCFQRSESIGRPSRQLTIEPDLGRPPVALHGDWRDFEHFGRLFDGESTEEAHFDNLHL